MGKHYGLDIPMLHELRIDVDKQWLDPNGLPREITNLKAIAADMAHGDVSYRGTDIMERLAAGQPGQFLQTMGPGFAPCWSDIPAGGIPVRFVFPPTLSIPEPSIGVEVATASSPPGKTATPPSLAIPEPTILAPTIATTSPQAVGAGIAHDDDPPIDTDETTQTNDATANDMHLLPSPGAVGDGFYFGLSDPFDWLCLNIGTPGVGTWTITWKYWNGTTWTALPLKYDGTNHFRAAAGKRWVHLNGRPGDWATTTILTYTLYFIKGEVTSYTSMTTQPLGTQAWIGRYA